jgi:hypothetical protein
VIGYLQKRAGIELRVSAGRSVRAKSVRKAA